MRALRFFQSVLARLFPPDPLDYTERDFTEELSLAANELIRNRETMLYLHRQVEYWERMSGRAIADVLDCEDKIAELNNTIHFLRNKEREYARLVAAVERHNATVSDHHRITLP